jgi:hypothetical protein
MTHPRKPSARELRRVLGAAAPTIGMLANNDQVTQQRIIALEAKVEVLDAFREMSFMQRLGWMFRGMK